MNYTYTNEKGEQEAVRTERWGWGVIYKDGTELKQFGDDGSFHRFAEIKQEEVRMFLMYKLDDQFHHVNILMEDGMQIFHRYQQNIWAAGTPQETRTTIYVFGWKDKETGKSVHHHILPDDRIIVSSTRREDIANMLPQAAEQ